MISKGGTKKIKRVLLAVAQSWSRHMVHEASFCGGCYEVKLKIPLLKWSGWKKIKMTTTKNNEQTKRSHSGS